MSNPDPQAYAMGAADYPSRPDVATLDALLGAMHRGMATLDRAERDHRAGRVSEFIVSSRRVAVDALRRAYHDALNMASGRDLRRHLAGLTPKGVR